MPEATRKHLEMRIPQNGTAAVSAAAAPTDLWCASLQVHKPSHNNRGSKLRFPQGLEPASLLGRNGAPEKRTLSNRFVRWLLATFNGQVADVTIVVARPSQKAN
jgi:hypothetical protein